jgi:hypothetical protein
MGGVLDFAPQLSRVNLALGCDPYLGHVAGGLLGRLRIVGIGGAVYRVGQQELFFWTTQADGTIIKASIKVRDWVHLLYLPLSGAGRHGLTRSRKHDPQNDSQEKLDSV